jgi:hypothetical protein
MYITILPLTHFRFVDYQFWYFTNAAQDLQHFLYTSAPLNLLDKHSVLVDEYHNTLQSTFTLLGHADLCPSMQQLHRQLEKLRRYAVMISCVGLPIVLADPHNIPDMEKMIKEGHSFHFSEKIKNAIKTLLPSFEQKGWLDFETA